jgi:O-6-methylguanine DNA methyltransferase
MSTDNQTPVNTTVCPTAFGWVGFSWSAQGLTAVTLPQDTEAAALSRLLAGTGSTPVSVPGFDPPTLSRRLGRYFEGEAIAFDEPLDTTIGTPFQRRVWAITRAIPRGETRTYGQIASEAGSPSAARAVGQAMARNPWPIIVPCHRVLGHDGTLTGFGGGLAMKQSMLEMEGALQPFALHPLAYWQVSARVLLTCRHSPQQGKLDAPLQ